tara:strand:+ start:2885 stop:3421 length:537 start_codon:yes stop_codon:yes gene_type:complete
MVKLKKYSIGFFGGSFDPPHIGHLRISLRSIKKLKLDKLYWVISKKNPFKKKTFFKLKERVKKSKNLVKKNKKIEIKFLDKRVKSSRTINILEYLTKKNKNSKFFLIIGSDNLIHFHKWKGYEKILKLSKLVVFSRYGYDQRSKKSPIMKKLKDREIMFIKDSRVNISSSQIRKIYLR